MGEAGRPREGESTAPLVGGGTGDNVSAPQLFTSLPALNEAASYINQATSYFGSCFSDYSVEYGGQDSCNSLSHPHELLQSTSGADGSSPVSVCVTPGQRFSTSSEASTSSASSPSRESTETISQASNAMVTSNGLGGFYGISMFQGLIERARRTVRGSADDIGWLQRDPEMPPVEDGTDRFNKILEDIGHGVHRLPNTLVYLLVPGLFSNHGPLYFVDTKTKFSKMGLACHIAKIHSEGDIQALEDLTYERRKEFLKNHPLPRELPTVSFRTEASISPAVLATLSHVAHAELPLTNQATKLPVVMPLGAAMAACAQLLQVRYGEKSDGLVTCCDAEVPGSVVVRPKRKLDHAWMVYSSLNEVPLEADAAQVCEALLTLLVQVEEEKQRKAATKSD
uniref:Uncharacterized protein n=1 Tax=Brassica campestris TaxID=3711 RepID=M4CKZ4_BRACM